MSTETTLMHIAVLPAEHRHPDVVALIEQYQAEHIPPDLLNGGHVAMADLKAALSAPGAELFLIRAEQQPVGFAIVGQHSRLHSDFAGHAILVFFIRVDQRRMGYGRAAAITIFDQYEGAWEIATYGVNIPGIAFWRSVADTYTGGRYEETWLQNATWRGSIQMFRAPGIKGETDHDANHTAALGSN